MSIEISNLKNTLSQFKGKHILVLGDVMLDEYHWCDVSRISPEAPVPVCNVNKTTHVPGGAANVAHNIQTLGAKVYLTGTIGIDSSGEKLLRILNDQKIDTSGLIKDEAKPTILKSRIIANQQQLVRIDRESAFPIKQELRNSIVKFITSKIKDLDAILISDYLKDS